MGRKKKEVVESAQTSVDAFLSGVGTQDGQGMAPVTPPVELLAAEIIKESKVNELPSLDQLTRDTVGETVKVSDIAVFLGTPEDVALRELAVKFSNKNTVNLIAEVNRTQVVKVGAQILRDGRMYLPIFVTKINGVYQCICGRHRLAFIAAVYGADAEIVVIVKEMTENEAQIAVIVLNENRAKATMEQAEAAVRRALPSVTGDTKEELYAQMSTKATNVLKYGLFCLRIYSYPVPLVFTVSDVPRKLGIHLTSSSNLAKFLKAAIQWHKKMNRQTYDIRLKVVVEFLNALVLELQKVDGFDRSLHLSYRTMDSIGKMHREFLNAHGRAMSPEEIVKFAGVLVSIVKQGNQNSQELYEQFWQAMRE